MTIPELTFENFLTSDNLEGALACRLAILPLTFVNIAWVEKFFFAVAVRFVFIEHSSVYVSIAKRVLSEAFSLSAIPLAFVGLPVLS